MLTWALAWFIVNLLRVLKEPLESQEDVNLSAPGCLMLITVPADVLIVYRVLQVVT